MNVYLTISRICSWQLKKWDWKTRFRVRLDFRRLPGPVFDPPRDGGWVRAHFPEQRPVIEPSFESVNRNYIPDKNSNSVKQKSQYVGYSAFFSPIFFVAAKEE